MNILPKLKNCDTPSVLFYGMACTQFLTKMDFFSSNRCGSRTEGPNGGAKKRWTIPPWSSTILPCYPSIGPKCLPALGQLPTPCPSIHGWPHLSPVPHPCTRYQGSWDLRRACSPLTRATLSSTPLRVWSKACSRWAPLPTSVRPASPIRAQWRTTGVLASRHSGWKPKSTFSRWIKPGSTCDRTCRTIFFSCSHKALFYYSFFFLSNLPEKTKHCTKGVILKLTWDL